MQSERNERCLPPPPAVVVAGRPPRDRRNDQLRRPGGCGQRCVALRCDLRSSHADRNDRSVRARTARHNQFQPPAAVPDGVARVPTLRAVAGSFGRSFRYVPVGTRARRRQRAYRTRVHPQHRPQSPLRRQRNDVHHRCSSPAACGCAAACVPVGGRACVPRPDAAGGIRCSDRRGPSRGVGGLYPPQPIPYARSLASRLDMGRRLPRGSSAAASAVRAPAVAVRVRRGRLLRLHSCGRGDLCRRQRHGARDRLGRRGQRARGRHRHPGSPLCMPVGTRNT
jgi:hypothetical protein